MSRREYSVQLAANRKLIVGEGESDRNFLAAFCARNGIDGFEYAFTGMHSPDYQPSGFSEFDRYLVVLSTLAGFQNLTDIVLACDSADNQAQVLTQLRAKIRAANRVLNDKGGPEKVYPDKPVANQVSAGDGLRVHALIVPMNANGGLESVCLNVARDNLNTDGDEGTTIEGWVNTFADSACGGWTTEKRDKLRLQAFISAAWKKKPEMHFSQLFDITNDKLVPLKSPSFNDIRAFLGAVAAL